MRACILSIGSELILGQITDTNATYLAQELSAAGIDLIYVTQVGDDRAFLLEALRRSLEVAELVICTGGVGPTDDDLTRETIAELVDEDPVIDETLLADLLDFFRGRGQEMPERNRKQAWVIPSATVLPNPVGTAPGWLVQTPDSPPRMIVAMPGVPREMFKMWKEQALPRIQEQTTQHIIDSVLVKTIGIGESAAEQLLHDLVLAADPQVATYAKDDGVHIRITAIGDDPAETRQRRNATRAEVMRRLNDYVWGEDLDTLPSVVARQLGQQGFKLGIYEIGTGGALSSLLATDAPSATSFEQATVKPAMRLSNADDVDSLALQHAYESAQMSAGTLGITLVYDGTLDERGVSSGQLAVAISDGSSPQPFVSRFQVRATLPEVQRRSALHAIDALRRYLGNGMTGER
jgi:nicotinamide-nucleotide amidase